MNVIFLSNFKEQFILLILNIELFIILNIFIIQFFLILNYFNENKLVKHHLYIY
jgi:hypothetical protein